MSTRRPTFSKSELISAWQCPKRLNLQRFHAELAKKSEQLLSLLETGHEVGEIAKQIYGASEFVEIPFSSDTNQMIEATADVLDAGLNCPIFEATFEHDGVLVRADVLIPDGDKWHLIEVKASTSVKEYHVVDCAIQVWVLRNAGVSLSRVSLAHVDNSFVYQGDGNYDGLLLENDLSSETSAMSDSVEELIELARETVSESPPEVPVGPQCNKPYECEFRHHCWPLDQEFPVPGIGGSKAKHADWVNRGIKDLRDIPSEELSNAKQERIHRVTTSGQPEILDGPADVLGGLDYPRFYLDFETIGPAIPIWKGMRPYLAMPVQWSVHIDDGNGDGSLDSMQHEEFLDLSGDPPMRALAESLIACLGNSGPVLMYTSYERRVINTLRDLYPDLDEPLASIIDRLFDLADVVADHYYHPSMLGSWSIKKVVPTMAPHMDYEELEGINVGTAAADGYLEAINPDTTPERKAELEEQLLRYCQFDTEAMVEVVSFLARR